MPAIPLAVFIFLWLIVFRRKARKGQALTRTEMFLLVGSFIIAAFGVILQFLAFSDNVPSYLIPYLPFIAQTIWVGLIIVSASLISIAIWHRKERIIQSLANHYHKKLEQKIGEELENEATTKNLALPHQLRNDVLSKLADQVSSDIVNKITPKVYLVQPMLDKKDDVYLAGLYLTIPMASAQVLAGKMTELSKDPQYRKKWKLFLLP